MHRDYKILENKVIRLININAILSNSVRNQMIAAALSGLIARHSDAMPYKEIAIHATSAAEAVMKELEK